MTSRSDERDGTVPVGSAPLITGLARAVSPFKGGCPNTPPCEHTGYVHETVGDDDPLPTCSAYNEVGPCPCGDAPAGFRRVAVQRVWQPGSTIPADAWAMTLDGAVWNHGSAWVNHFPAPLFEVEPVWDGGPPPTASQQPGGQPTGQPGPANLAGRYTVRFDHIGRHPRVPPLVDIRATNANHLAALVLDYANQFLYSDQVDVRVDLEQMTGSIVVGMVRPAGSFTIERVDQPASGQPEGAAGVQAT